MSAFYRCDHKPVSIFALFYLETNLRSNNFIRQETVLKEILDEITFNECKDENSPTKIQKDLNDLRNYLLNDKQLRFYTVSDLNKLHDHVVIKNGQSLDAIWLEHFPATLTHNDQLVCVDNQPFNVPLTWNFQKQANKRTLKHTKVSATHSASDLSDLPKVFSPTPNRDFLINLGATESSYVRLLSSIDIDSYTHPSYAGILVLIEYFTQAEGPLWEAVRGPGYCYHQTSTREEKLL